MSDEPKNKFLHFAMVGFFGGSMVILGAHHLREYYLSRPELVVDKDEAPRVAPGLVQEGTAVRAMLAPVKDPNAPEARKEQIERLEEGRDRPLSWFARLRNMLISSGPAGER